MTTQRLTPVPSDINISADRSGVEVIIPSYGRPTTLQAGLHWLRQLYPELSIRVALQGEDIRQDLLKVFSAGLTVDWRPDPDLIGALNDSIALSTAEICILLDDDARPFPGWLEAHLAALKAHPSAAYCYGRVIEDGRWRTAWSDMVRLSSELLFGWGVPRRARLYGRIVGWITSTGMVFGNFYLPGDCVINAPAEGNLALRRTSFLEVGGFNPAFRGNCWGYGPELGLRLARRGVFGRYVGGAMVLHCPAFAGGTRAQKTQWYADFVANNQVVARAAGPLGWTGALPRLIRRYVVR